MKKEEVVSILTKARIDKKVRKTHITHNLSVDGFEKGKDSAMSTLFTYAEAVGYEVIVKPKA